MRRAIATGLHTERGSQVLLAGSGSETGQRAGFAVRVVGGVLLGGGLVLAAFEVDV